MPNVDVDAEAPSRVGLTPEGVPRSIPLRCYRGRYVNTCTGHAKTRGPGLRCRAFVLREVGYCRALISSTSLGSASSHLATRP